MKSQKPTAKVKQTKNKLLTKSSYLILVISLPLGGDLEGVFYNNEKQRNLETNHPNRNQYPIGHRHYAWPEFVPLSL